MGDPIAFEAVRRGLDRAVDRALADGGAVDVSCPPVVLGLTDLAVAMSVVAAVIPPIAVIVANWGEDH